MNKKVTGILCSLCLTVSWASNAEVVSKTIDYRDGDAELRGHLYYDNSIEGKRPGVLVVHEWWGLNDYAKKRAEMLAELGYVAFAADMYGDQKVTLHAKEAVSWMIQITNNIDAWQKRVSLGLEAMNNFHLTDPDKTAAIGYCFGGATVMQLAYSGADIDGVVSFHGSLPITNDKSLKKVRAKVMVAHGYADSFIPKEHLAKFKDSLEKSDIDWQFDTYSGAKHGFTNPGASAYGMDKVAYNKNADQRSWQKMQLFFDEIFE